MLTPKFRDLLEEYHRRKWFPMEYPDPFGEFIDCISEGMIRDLQESWQKTRERSLLSVAYYIFKILPTVQFGDLLRVFGEGMNKPLTDKNIPPEFAFYYLRALPDEEGRQLWEKLQKWALTWMSVTHDWLQALLRFEMSFTYFEQVHYKSMGLRPDTELPALEKKLLESRDIFEWQVTQHVVISTLFELVQYFRFNGWDELADWTDFRALAKTISERCHVPQLPDIRQNASNNALLFLFPVSPPSQVILEHGKGSGAYDALRFLFELGKGFFYCGMNPKLTVENRICGDPALPLFWGFLYSQLLADGYSVANLIDYRAEELAEEMRLALDFSYRYDIALTLYRARVRSDLKDAQDLYVHCMETAFPLEAPHFLYLYDLNRSSEAFFRVIAHRSARAVAEHLSFLNGKYWFTSEKLARRFREYWWEGFRFSLKEVLKDLNVSIPE